MYVDDEICLREECNDKRTSFYTVKRKGTDETGNTIVGFYPKKYDSCFYYDLEGTLSGNVVLGPNNVFTSEYDSNSKSYSVTAKYDNQQCVMRYEHVEDIKSVVGSDASFIRKWFTLSFIAILSQVITLLLLQ